MIVFCSRPEAPADTLSDKPIAAHNTDAHSKKVFGPVLVQALLLERIHCFCPPAWITTHSADNRDGTL